MDRREKRIDLFEILKSDDRYIFTDVILYAAIETIVDPIEKNTEKAYLNPTAIKAYVRDITFSALKWKYPGRLETGSKEVIIETKWLNHFLIADRIDIDGKHYKVYKDDSQGFQYLEHADYVRILLRKT